MIDLRDLENTVLHFDDEDILLATADRKQLLRVIKYLLEQQYADRIALQGYENAERIQSRGFIFEKQKGFGSSEYLIKGTYSGKVGSN